MAEFTYKIKTQADEIVEGKIEAVTQESAIESLQSKNFVVLSIESAQKNLFEKDILASVSKPNKKDLVIFTRQLATLIGSDVPLLEGLRILSRQTEKHSFAKMINDIAASVEGGSSLSTALGKNPKLFNTFFVSLVRSGEVSGKLDTTLLYMADYLERSAELTSKVRGALSYPGFVLFAMIVVSILMVTKVLPNLLGVLKESGVQDLPFTTKVLIFTTDFVNGHLLILSIILAILTYSIVSFLRTEKGLLKLDRLKIDMPIFGVIVRNLYIARISETLATLIRSGVPILQGLEITSDVVGNRIFKTIILEAKENVKGGGTISETLAKYEEFPPLVSSMLSVGEKTGKTDFMLDNILRFYKRESENAINNISQLIEPLLIFILGIGVAILVASILLPIYSLVGGA